MILSIIILGIVTYLCFYFLDPKLQSYRIFKMGRNPYSRICKKCGQQQDMFETCSLMGNPIHYWEDMGSVKDETCKCHKYSK